MESLFKTQTNNTFEEYKRFSWALLLKKRTVVILILCELILFFASWLLKSLFYFTFAILYPLFVWLLQNRQIKKVFNSNKILQNTVVEYTFYDTFFTSEHESGNNKIDYDKLYKIIETKTNFYLMIAKNQGYILSKNTIPNGLGEFLRNLKIS